MIIFLEPSVDNNKLDLWMLPMDTVQVADVLAFKVVVRAIIAIIRHFIMPVEVL